MYQVVGDGSSHGYNPFATLDCVAVSGKVRGNQWAFVCIFCETLVTFVSPGAVSPSGIDNYKLSHFASLKWKSPRNTFKRLLWPGMMADPCNPSSWESEAKGLPRVQGQPGLQGEFQAKQSRTLFQNNNNHRPLWCLTCDLNGKYVKVYYNK